MDIMIDFLIADDAFSQISVLMREHRVAKNITQVQLAQRSGVSLSVLKKFETTGKISLESFVKLAFVLGLTDRILNALKPQNDFISMDELLESNEKPKRKNAYSPRKKNTDD